MAARPGKRFAAYRAARRRRLAVSFTRVLAHRPMGDALVGKIGAHWRAAIQSWRRKWAEARANSATIVRDRKGGLVLRG